MSLFHSTYFLAFFLLIGTLMISPEVEAQMSQSAELTYKSGTKVKCQVIKLVPEESVTIVLLKDTLVVPWERLESIDLNESTNEVVTPQSVAPKPVSPGYVIGNTQQYYTGMRIRKDVAYSAKSLYFMGGLTLRGAVSPWFVLNPGTSMSLGYNINSKLGVGATIASDVYWNTDASLYPLGVEGVYRINDKGFSTQFSLKTGYSMARHRNTFWNRFTDISGGAFVNFGIGIISKKREHLGWYCNFNTMLTRVTETGLTNFNTGRGFEQVEAVNVRNIARSGFTFGMYID